MIVIENTQFSCHGPVTHEYSFAIQILATEQVIIYMTWSSFLKLSVKLGTVNKIVKAETPKLTTQNLFTP